VCPAPTPPLCATVAGQTVRVGRDPALAVMLLAEKYEAQALFQSGGWEARRMVRLARKLRRRAESGRVTVRVCEEEG